MSTQSPCPSCKRDTFPTQFCPHCGQTLPEKEELDEEDALIGIGLAGHEKMHAFSILASHDFSLCVGYQYCPICGEKIERCVHQDATSPMEN